MTNSQENAQNTGEKEKAQELRDKVQEAAQATGGKAKETAETAKGKVQEAAETTQERARESAQAARGKVQETAEAARRAEGTQATERKLPTVIPNLDVKAESSAQDLKDRLDWGEPALTIIDVRDRTTHNQGHIRGALPVSMNQLVEHAQSNLDPKRDIYVYGATDQETAQAASRLREAEFVNVAELKGGLNAWRKIAGPTDGIKETKG